MDAVLRNYVHAETAKFTALSGALQAARRRGYLYKSELVAVCKWKSSRALPLVQKNHGNTVIAITRRALNARNEEEKMAELISLSGVGVPMASAILAAMNPQRYGVIDIRVWQVLYRFRVVRCTSTGIGLRVRHWATYLEALRAWSSAYGLSARAVEQAIFKHHIERVQNGRLYA